MSAGTSLNSYQAPSTLRSWNTRFSRTQALPSLSTTASTTADVNIQGLEDVLTAVHSLNLDYCHQNDLETQEVVGQGETFVVERCSMAARAVAVKHLRLCQRTTDTSEFQRRLESVLLEIRIMRHRPLSDHENLLKLIGYGWNTAQSKILPYIVVEYSSFGTFREYLESNHIVGHTWKEALIGDVVIGMQALHKAGIVHGDIKLENVLLFESSERPVPVMAKLCDFGHSLLLQGFSEGRRKLYYKGTDMYNAPEVRRQYMEPIELPDLPRCDVWALGLLMWEVFLGGGRYTNHLPELYESQGSSEEPRYLLETAKSTIFVPGNGLRRAVVEAALSMTLQNDPMLRTLDLWKIPFVSKWHKSKHFAQSQSASLASMPTTRWSFNVFRSDQQTRIPWDHQKEIYTGYERFLGIAIKDETIAACSWQIAICQFLGFGVGCSSQLARVMSQRAVETKHPVADFFLPLLQESKRPTNDNPGANYGSFIVRLVRSHYTPYRDNLLFDACRKGDAQQALQCIAGGSNLGQVFPGGSTLFHWLFMFNDATKKSFQIRIRNEKTGLPLNLACKNLCVVHEQWPLELSGTPLAIATSVGDLAAVRLLLDLGADPFAKAFCTDQFKEDIHGQHHWTAFDVAIKYHAPDILQCLLDQIPVMEHLTAVSCPSALCFSCPLERLALHGAKHEKKLLSTIKLLGGMTSLACTVLDKKGPLMKAIEFNDAEVVSGILEIMPSLAATQSYNPSSPLEFDVPATFAAELAAKRDGPEATRILRILHDAKPETVTQTDSSGRSPLHLASIGPYSRAAQWIIDICPSLRDARDANGSTPLHYCASRSTCDLMLCRGADVEAIDRKGRSAIHHAVQVGAMDIAETLIHAGANVDLRCKCCGSTPLHYAVVKNNREIAMLLLSGGAAVDLRDQNGRTPLSLASSQSPRRLVKLLVDHSANPNAEDHSGRGPIYYAVRADNFDAVEIMLRSSLCASADRILDGQNNTLLHTCARYGNSALLKLLLSTVQQCVRLSELRNRRNETVLHLSARNTDASACALLLEHSQNSKDTLQLANAVDGYGNTAGHLAVSGAARQLPEFGRRLPDTLDKLGAKGASFSQENCHGELPWDIMFMRPLSEETLISCVRAILCYDDPENLACRRLFDRGGDYKGNALLAMAIQKNDPEAFIELIRSNCINVEDMPTLLKGYVSEGNTSAIGRLITVASWDSHTRSHIVRGESRARQLDYPPDNVPPYAHHNQKRIWHYNALSHVQTTPADSMTLLQEGTDVEEGFY